MERINKLIGVAVTSDHQYCTMVYSYATFDELQKDFDLYNKSYSSTNWNGYDKLSRTLQLENLELTGRSFKHLGESIGSDYDSGYETHWVFKFDEILEVIIVR